VKDGQAAAQDDQLAHHGQKAQQECHREKHRGHRVLSI